ncbi:MAG: class I SAM-dependent methyltransferase, partial [Anaerolineae bacterium]
MTKSPKRWDAARYDRKHAYVWQYGADLIELLGPEPGQRILDLGCGTGHLTARIAAAGAEVAGLDRDERMIARAREQYPGLAFRLADATDFKVETPFDAVFSNAVLHWINEPARVARCVWRALRPGGRFVAELGGRGNIQTVVASIGQALAAAGYPQRQASAPWYFPSVGQYASLLEAQGLQVSYAALFDRPTALNEGQGGLAGWLEMFAAHFFEGIPPAERRALVQTIEEDLRPRLYRDGTWFIDYRRLRVVAYKEMRPES